MDKGASKREESTSMRDSCWACGKKIVPAKAPRALCSECAYGGYFGAS